jgi:hypothetical protein
MAKNIQFMKKDELLTLAVERGLDVSSEMTSKEIRVLLGEPVPTAETPSKILSYDEKLKKEPRVWVRVLNRDLSENVDFGFTFERHRWHLMNGEVCRLPRSVVEHLKSIRYPVVKYKQGEAGQGVKVHGYYYRFAITTVEAPEPKAVPV